VQYELDIEGEIISLDFSPAEREDTAEVSTGTGKYRVSFQTVPDGRLHLVIDGKAMEAFVADTPEGKHVFVNGRTFMVKDDVQEPARKRHGSGDDIPQLVTPPMPSVVVRILVETGHHVGRGQGLVVVSAMKMEATLVAPHDGTVTRINTAVDAKVAPGDILVEIKKEDSGDG
jgi:biotin carboxyl carrier protein